MPSLTMTVKYVNPPTQGKRRGTIKGADNQYLGVFGDKIHLFQAGQTYEIEYTESTSTDGVTYRNVVTASQVMPAQASKPVADVPVRNNGGGNTYRETCAKDAERMFVCGALNAALHSSQVQPTRQSVGVFVNVLRGVWRDSFGVGDIDAPYETQRQARG